MAYTHKLVTKSSFIGGTYRPAGFPVVIDDKHLSGKETNLADLDKGFKPAVVEMSALGPTGPNPSGPQQIPPGAIQHAGGWASPGVELVAEVARPDKGAAGLLDFDENDKSTAEGDIRKLLRETQAENARLKADAAQGRTRAAHDGNTQSDSNDAASDKLVEGNAPEVIESLGGLTDEQLADARKAEIDREKPRKSVTSAIDAELERRKG